MRRNDKVRAGVDGRAKKMYIARRMGMSDNRMSDIRDPTVISESLPCVLVLEF